MYYFFIGCRFAHYVLSLSLFGRVEPANIVFHVPVGRTVYYYTI